MPFRPSRRALLLGVPALLLAAGVASAAWMMRVPADLDLSLRKATEAGLYVAEIAPEAEPVTVGPMHSWTVTVQGGRRHAAGGGPHRVDGGHALSTVMVFRLARP
jgi:hypothetical protein